jgi:hypothetical protein
VHYPTTHNCSIKGKADSLAVGTPAMPCTRPAEPQAAQSESVVFSLQPGSPVAATACYTAGKYLVSHFVYISSGQ